MPKKLFALPLAALSLTPLVGCGSKTSHVNDPRPPVTKEISVFVSNRQVTIAPKLVGAGPTLFTVTNRSNRTVSLFLAKLTADNTPTEIGKRATAPIAPGRTGSLKANLAQGNYSVLGNPSTKAATLKVGKQRESSSGELLLP